MIDGQWHAVVVSLTTGVCTLHSAKDHLYFNDWLEFAFCAHKRWIPESVFDKRCWYLKTQKFMNVGILVPGSRIIAHELIGLNLDYPEFIRGEWDNVI